LWLTLSRLRSVLFLSEAAPPSWSYTLSLHDALPILWVWSARVLTCPPAVAAFSAVLCIASTILFTCSAAVLWCSPRSLTCSFRRSEEHTSELQSRFDLVCRLLLEKKNTTPSSLLIGRLHCAPKLTATQIAATRRLFFMLRTQNKPSIARLRKQSHYTLHPVATPPI